MRLWPDSLAGRVVVLATAFVLIVLLAALLLWRLFRAEVVETRVAEFAAMHVRAVSALIALYPQNPSRLLADGPIRLLAAEEAEPPERLPAPPALSRVEERLTHELAQAVELRFQLRSSRAVWIGFSAQGRRWWLVLPLTELDAPAPPVLSWVALAMVLGAGLALYLIYRVQRPLQLLREAIGGQQTQAVQVPQRSPVEVRELAAAYNRLMADLRQRDAERETLLAGVSHDLRSPLARLRLRAEAVSEPSVAAGIVRDVEAMGHIVDQFLAFVRGQTESEFSQCDAASVARALAERYREAEVRMQAPASAPAAITELSLTRALSNLIDNALSYGRQPIDIRVEAAQERVRILVIDRGEGLDESSFERARQPFVRLDDARGERGHCGLGLAIVDRLIGGARGQMSCRKLTEGFAIVIDLPVASG